MLRIKNKLVTSCPYGKSGTRGIDTSFGGVPSLQLYFYIVLLVCALIVSWYMAFKEQLRRMEEVHNKYGKFRNLHIERNVCRLL